MFKPVEYGLEQLFNSWRLLPGKNSGMITHRHKHCEEIASLRSQ
jgi:hypothetical protein